MKKTNLISVAALCAILLASCGDTTPPQTDITQEVPTTTTETPVTEESGIHASSYLPEADFGGAEYHIMGREYANLGDLPSYEFTTDRENGDLINDTVFRRCQIVEELYNVTITSTQYASGDAVGALETSQLAGDYAFDLAWSHIGSMTSMVTKGLLSNYYDIPHIDLTAPWWNQLATESLTVNGQCHLQMNYIPFTGVLLSHCLFFNKDLAQKYDVPSLYDHVRNNTWTFDTFAEYVKLVSQDVNGDSIYDESDLYGLLSSKGTSGTAMSVAMGVKPISIADDGTFTLCMVSDRNQALLEKMSDVIESPASYMTTDYSKENDLARMFANDQALFYSGFLTDTYRFFRAMESDYGLLPFPKADENQEMYVTTISGGTGLLGIPLVLEDPDMTGLITEALAIESYHYIYPAIYETVFEDKLLRDDDSKEMFDIVMSGMEIDFGRIFKYERYADLFAELLSKKSRDLASSAQKMEKSTQKHYQKIIDVYFAD